MTLPGFRWRGAFGVLLAGGVVVWVAAVGCSGSDSVEPADPPPASTCLDEAQDGVEVPCPEPSEGTNTEGLVEPQTVESSTIGKAAYLQRCVGCHGIDGSGIVGPDIRPNEVLEKYASAEVMEALVREGLGEMPEFASKLSDDEIAAVVAYVRGGLG